MSAPDEASIALFSYGTLQLKDVQRATFGRLLDGRPDVLPGYVLEPLANTDQRVIATSGAAVHRIACRTGIASDLVSGVVFNIIRAELEAADAYEVDAYGRVEVSLASGASAFAFVGPEKVPELR